MNSKLFCSAVLFVLFICIVANFNNNKGLFNKVISIDLPGHGGTPPSNASTIEEYADFITACLKELGLSDFHLCGHSMGGLVCMSLASSNRKIFKSVYFEIELIDIFVYLII